VSAFENYTDAQSANLALQEIIGHLSDISTALDSIACELEGIRHALESPVVASRDEPVATYTPVNPAWGEMTLREWDAWFGGSR
jgi:hypothetical protein